MTDHHTIGAGNRSRNVLRLIGAALLAGTLAGCYQSTVAQQSTYPTDYRERHPITLREGEQTVQVFVSRNRGGLNPMQRADVLSFAQLWRRESSSGIIIDVPHGGGVDRAARDSLHEIQSIFAASGVPRNAIYVRRSASAGEVTPSIQLRYAKLIAHAGPCGLWPKDIGPAAGAEYLENGEYWNFGCAAQRNLAAMVDNPADLVQPRGEVPTYTNQRSVAIEKFRKGDSPSVNYKGYDTGKISDLGK